jgi:hypothetical protein
METLQVIGLHGYAGVGKSTLAKELERLGWTRISLSTPIKEMLKAIGLSEDDLANKNSPPALAAFNGKTTRYLLQTLGTEWGRNLVSPTIWVDLAAEKIKRLHMEGVCKVVIDDVRFPEEAEMVRSLGGSVVLIERRGHKNSGITNEAERQHSSESRLSSRYLAWSARIAEGRESVAEVARTLDFMSGQKAKGCGGSCYGWVAW